MQALPLNEVPARVAAWHNRHPLARRIRAAQVHSIGTVVLPFASAQPWPVDPGAAPGTARAPRHGPSLAEVVSARAAARPGATTPAPDPSAPQADAGAQAEPRDADRQRAPEARAVADEDPDTAGAAGASLRAEPALDAGGPAARRAAAGPARPAGWLQRLLARLGGHRPGTPRLVAVFDRDLVWPLTPAQVARWARRHGQPVWPTPADGLHRTVDADPARLAALRRKGLQQTVHLTVLTAAIGVGDRRLRLLLDLQGGIVGPRAYSRPRVAGAAALCLSGLLALAGPGLLSSLTAPGDGALQPVLASASASAPDPASAVVAGGEAAAAASATASAVGPEGPATTTALSFSAPPADGGPADRGGKLAATPVSPRPSAAADAPGPGPAAATADAAAPAPIAATAPPQAPPGAAPPGPSGAGPAAQRRAAAAEAMADGPPPDPAQAIGPAIARADAAPAPGRIRPALSEEEKRAARQVSEQARAQARPAPVPAPAEAAIEPAAPVYAVVSRPSPSRDAAAGALAAMQSARARLPAPAPGQGDLMRSQGAWRAAWWPFASLVDAERARVMLAGQGVKAEVVEF